MAVAGFAIKRGAGRNENAFNEGMIGEAPKEFLSGVPRALLPQQFEGVQSIVFSELVPQSFWKIGHGVPVDGAMKVKPLEKLADTVHRLAPGLKLDLQFFQGL
jgi:hypothetical protein